LNFRAKNPKNLDFDPKLNFNFDLFLARKFKILNFFAISNSKSFVELGSKNQIQVFLKLNF